MILVKQDGRLRVVRLIIVTAMVFSAGSLFAGINIDYCRFRAEDGEAYLEMYIEIPRLEVQHVTDSSGWYGAVRFTVGISSDSVLLAKDNWRIGDVITDPNKVDSLQKIIDVRTYKLTPGVYEIAITAVDSFSQRSWDEFLNVDIESFPNDRLTLSDIEIAGYLLPPGLIDKYDRGEYGLIPSPNLVFGRKRPYFYYYLEIYPPLESKGKYELSLQRMIFTDIGGKQFLVESLPEVVFDQESNAFADVDSVSLNGLASGSYTFAVQVVSSHGDTVLQAKRFWIMRPDLQVVGIERFEDDVVVDRESVEAEFQEIQILLNKDEIKRTEEMSTIEKARFLNVFWRRYDDNKSTSEVPFRQEFRARIAEAEHRWKNYWKPGYKTDMGRIFVLHGEPDHKEIHPLELNTKPYEIWTYDRLEGGGIQFVFVDRGGQGDFILVHSNKRGEISQPE